MLKRAFYLISSLLILGWSFEAFSQGTQPERLGLTGSADVTAHKNPSTGNYNRDYTFSTLYSGADNAYSPFQSFQSYTAANPSSLTVLDNNVLGSPSLLVGVKDGYSLSMELVSSQSSDFAAGTGTYQIVTKEGDGGTYYGAGSSESSNVGFSAGDAIKVTLQQNGTDISTLSSSTGVLSTGNPSSSASGWYSRLVTYDQVVDGKNQTVNYRDIVYVARGEIVAVIEARPAASYSGSPLPGVWATLALCGVVGGYIKRRKASL